MAELGEDARAVADRVNIALQEFCHAVKAREREAERVNGLVTLATGGRNRPGFVAWRGSAVERIATDCAAVIDAGGERPPLLRTDPRPHATPEAAA